MRNRIPRVESAAALRARRNLPLENLALSAAANGAVFLKIQGDASRTYTVESSENLVNGSVFRADVASGAAVALPPSPRPQFYRALALP